MKAARIAMKDQTNIKAENIERLKQVLPYIGVSGALKFNESFIRESLEKMKDINPTFSAVSYKMFYF